MSLRGSAVRYVLVGAALFGLDLTLFLALVRLGGWPVPHAQLVSRIAGAATGFLLHRAWTFAGSTPHRLHVAAQGAGYTLLVLFNVAFSPLLVTLLAAALAPHLVLAKVVAEILLTIETFLCTRWLLGRREP